MSQTDRRRDPPDFTNEPKRPTADEYLSERLRKKFLPYATVLVRRGRSDVLLTSEQRVPEPDQNTDVYIMIREG